jgi:hypothetical protein
MHQTNIITSNESIAKIDGIIEVSGPNWKVDTTHFIDDRVKIAKNLKIMHRYIMDLRDDPYIVFRRSFKVYGLHIYCKFVINFS